MLIKLATAATAALAIGLAGTAGAASAAAQSATTSVRHAGSVPAVKDLKCSPMTGQTLDWRGGPITPYAWVTLIYWGSWWKSHGKAVKAELKDLYSGLAASSWARTLTQYCDTTYGHPGWPPDLVLTKPVIVAVKQPGKPTEKQFGNMIATYAPPSNGGTTGIDVIVTPPGTVPRVDAKRGYCSHHDWSQITVPKAKGGGYIAVPWVDLAYGIIRSSGGCGFGQGVLGALSVAAGHEWAEAVTDPFINSSVSDGLGSGWATPGGSEVADLCKPGAKGKNVFTLKLKTGSFKMQELWSNAAGKCVASS